ASSALEDYRHYLDRIAQFRSHNLPEEVEQTRNRDSLTGRQAFLRLRAVHLGEQKYEPVTLSLGEVADTDAELEAMLGHPDADKRYDAYRSVRQVMQQHNLLHGFILNTIAQDHRIESQMRGYPSTLHKQLLADEVPESVFRVIMNEVGDRFELFQRYYQLKGKAIGQKIRTCDLYAPWSTDDEPPTSLDYKTGVEILIEALKQFDVFYGNRAEEFFLRNHVDAKVRAGKRSGAFCFPTSGKYSYLLLSYTDDYKSLFTLVRQIGHGLHYALSGDRQTYFNSKPPLILAEIASTFNELVLLDYLLKQATDDQHLKKVLLTRLIEDQLNLLFRQTTLSRLELAIHERAYQSSFDHNFVNETWMQLYRELCGDAVDVLPEHQYDWAGVDRIYVKPFSCFQYTASNIVSLVCYQKYLAIGKDFISGYLNLLTAGGSLNQVDALRRYVEVDLEDPATIRGALYYVEGLINQLQAIL
ncbi:MAG: M3 family metallopeptidase, partial [Coleofasciculus sp. S288]|nr:M3 family metallopeptidase [Coleofasciculus sp. S288]